MSYKIVFTGKIEERYLDNVRGMKLAEDWKNGKMPEKFTIDNDVYETKAIKAIIANVEDPDKTSKYNENADKMKEIDREWNEWRAKEMEKSVEERGRELAFARYVWHAIKGKRPTKEEEDFIVERSIEWLREHPDFHRANPVAYLQRSDLKVESRQGQPVSIKDQLKVNALLYAERHLDV